MRVLPRVTALKVIATILFILTTACMTAFGIGFGYAAINGYFELPQAESYLESSQLSMNMQKKLDEAAKIIAEKGVTALPQNTSLAFSLTKDGRTEQLSPNSQAFSDTHTELELPTGAILSAELKNPPAAQDIFYYDYNLYDLMYGSKYVFCIVTVSCLGVSLFLAYFLLCGAGRKRKSELVHLNMADKLPLDLYATLVLGGDALVVWISWWLLRELSLWTLFVIIPCLLVLSSINTALMISAAKRVKNGTWWSDMILRHICVHAREVIKHSIRDVEKVLVNLPTVWRVLFSAIIYLAATVIAINNKSGVITVVWLVISIAAIVFVCLGVISADKLKNGAEKLAQGDLDYKIDTDGMFGPLKGHAENLNSIGDVLTKAVDERTRSEKFKAELITNVSHDIKTPITSIINYVDLLGRENLTDEQRAEYLDVLRRQSARLKKLTVDLVEASKASTGNISVKCERLDVCEMLKQATGEFSERIAAAGLQLELEFPDHAVEIFADGRLLWRVFENLLTNICKYSLPGTRVYVTAGVRDGNAVTDFKNISRDRLKVSGKELSERFVRGDSARSTEGSGLGLSIAGSFTELQGGTFDVTVDGDLFKAEIAFPLYANSCEDEDSKKQTTTENPDAEV